MTKKIGVILLAICLIQWGLLSISNFQFEFSAVLMGVLAGAAGVFLLLDR